MAFIEKQRHGKHDYYYLVKSVRQLPEKVSKVRVFLGRSVPPHDVLQKHFLELERKTPKPYVAKWLSKNTVERLEDLRATALAFKKSPEEELPKDFLVRFTYNTNAIEGNPLTLRQTALILNDGIAPEGAKTDDVMEVINARDAWQLIRSYKGTINKAFVSRVQYEVTKNTACRIQGDYRDSEVKISGSSWTPPPAKEVPNQMKQFFKDYPVQRRKLHPVEVACWAHNLLVQIHPFTDGNGRTSRLVMNWLLLKGKLPPAIIEARNKEAYYAAIEKADAGDFKPFAEFLAVQLLNQYTIKSEIKDAE